MAETRNELKARIKRRIVAESSTPTVPDFNDSAIEDYLQEATRLVNSDLRDIPGELDKLYKIGVSLAITAGKAPYPSDFESELAIYVSATYNDLSGDPVTVTERTCLVFHDPATYRSLDSGNFVGKPSLKRPVCLLADQIYFKPTSISTGSIDYIRRHPALSNNVDTLYTDRGDSLLVGYALRFYYLAHEEQEMVNRMNEEIKELTRRGTQS